MNVMENRKNKGNNNDKPDDDHDAHESLQQESNHEASILESITIRAKIVCGLLPGSDKQHNIQPIETQV